MDINFYSFHDSVINRFSYQDNNIEIAIEGVLFSGKEISVLVEIESVNKLIIDHEISDRGSLMEADFAGILTFEKKTDYLYLIAEWHDFSPKRDFIRCYKIYGGNIIFTKI